MRNVRRMELNAAAFLGVIIIAEVSPAWPHHPPPNGRWWLAGVSVTVAAAALCVLVRGHRLGRWLRYVPLVLFFVAVQMLRAADGNGSAGFSPLLILPVVWYALYGSRLSVYLALAGVAAVQFGPLIVVGAPEYPVTLWRAAVLWVLILSLVGVAAQRLVTALHEKSTALAASQARFRTAFDDAPVGVALVGAAGAQTGVYLQVNRALCALLGSSEDWLVGRSVLDVTHPEDRGLTEQHLLAPAERQLAQTVQKRYLHSSGREVPASITYSRIQPEPGSEPYFIVHVQDLSLRRDADLDILSALEQQKQTTEQLQRLDRTRTALVSAVTDELRRPIAGISDAVTTLGGDAADLTTWQTGLLRDIERHTGRLAAISAELGNLARTEDQLAGQLVQLVDLQAVVRAAIASIRPAAAGRDLALQVEINLSGAQIVGEADKIDRALRNLLDNAVKFTPPGGAIDTQARVRGDTVEIDVTDTGIGIESDEIDQIFDRFYRARAAAQQSTPGTGLGLTIAKAIAEQHHGSIQVFSEPGAGSTFRIILPLPNARVDTASS